MANLPAAASFTGVGVTQAGFQTAMDDLRSFLANQLGTIDGSAIFKAGAGAVATPSFSFSADPDTGFYSAGANQLGIAAGGVSAAVISNTGITLTLPVGIGSVNVGSNFNNSKNITGSVFGRGFSLVATIQSDVTTNAIGYQSNLSTQAAAFTINDIWHYLAGQGTFGAGSSIINQYGYTVSSSLIGATNNYAFHSNIAFGTGRWNFYSNGTADNAFSGNSRFGGLTSPTVAVDVTGAVLATTSIKSNGATAGIGYATGAGGAITQLTSKATGVTLNKICGQITMNAAALAAATAASFVLTDSAITATDIVHVTIASGATAGAYHVMTDVTGAGSCTISLRNLTAGSLSEAVVLNFAVLKSVVA